MFWNTLAFQTLFVFLTRGQVKDPDLSGTSCFNKIFYSSKLNVFIISYLLYKLMKYQNTNKMKLCLLLFLVTVISGTCFAQKIFITEWKSEANKKVYITNWKNEADMLVYVTEWKSEAKPNSGLWFFTNWKNEADWKIYYTNWKSEADLIIYYTNWKSEAGWKEK